MVNLQNFIEKNGVFKTFKVNELLFAEFRCPMKEGKDSIWWHNNFFFYIMSGETELISPQDRYAFKTGDFGFAKKGSIITQTQAHEDFCELIIFVPDTFIRSVAHKHVIPIPKSVPDRESDTVMPLPAGEIIHTYFHSLFNHFNHPEPPPKSLLKLKFEELILNILSSDRYAKLKVYFREICQSTRPSIRSVMEANYSYNLTITEYATLCGRSLSSFKSEFKSIYQTTPGKWLKEKRLQYSRYLLENTDKNIGEVTFESGFENETHFIRLFKDKYGLPPGKYQLKFQST
jgi:AraC-like DNA-binding protein